MEIFELIKAFFLILPFGIFLTFTLMVVVNSTMKVQKANTLLRRVSGFYCGSAAVAGFLLMTYYYMPGLFARLDLLYFLSATLSMVLFYHFFHYATSPGVRFNRLHYIIPSLAVVVLLVVKFSLPAIWTQEGVRALLIIALFFGIVYSLLTLARMQRYFIELAVNQRKMPSVNTLQMVVYAVEAILFPVVFVFFPLVGGQTPGVLLSSLLMASILLALRANIPFTYAIVRHYTSFDTQNRSLFENLVPLEQPPTREEPEKKEVQDNKQQNRQEEKQAAQIQETQEQEEKQEEKEPEKPAEQQPATPVSKRETSLKKVLKKPLKKPKSELPPGFDKTMFNNFMRSRKPFLNPDITIADVAKAMESNRTYLSGFVNTAYKMNFTSYINLCRLREMNRLLALPKNKDRTAAELIPQTGFGTIRNYVRTRRQFAVRIKKTKREKPLND